MDIMKIDTKKDKNKKQSPVKSYYEGCFCCQYSNYLTDYHCSCEKTGNRHPWTYICLKWRFQP